MWMCVIGSHCMLENGTKGERMGVVSRHSMVCGCDCSIAR